MSVRVIPIYRDCIENYLRDENFSIKIEINLVMSFRIYFGISSNYQRIIRDENLKQVQVDVSLLLRIAKNH